MRLPSKSNRSEASSYLSPRRSHGVLIEAKDSQGCYDAFRHESC